MNTAGSVLLDTNVVVAHLRTDPDLTARLRATSVLYLPWVVIGLAKWLAEHRSFVIVPKVACRCRTSCHPSQIAIHAAIFFL